ncbi:MAG TPA: hypothetical protein DEB42_00580 [Jeotgalicoccus sp.]|nr:hypothetical protein [Jeotgalicoccus sp.]
MAGNTPLGRMLIDIDLDTTKLGSSTTHLQRQMRIVNSAMRANLAGLKDNSKETDVLSTKIDGLNKKQKIQAGIVEQTEKRYQELVKTKGAGAKETEAYANSLNREQAKLREVTNELKEMERQQKVMNSNWTKLGNSFGTLGSQLTSIGGGIKSVGSSLTRSITMPAVGAATAVGGIVAAFGWKRLVSLDAAQAQLKGLGYSIEDVERISAQVQEAVQGTTMTMAEGTSVAAGALAAGVDEGAELEHYIKMVGNAAVGANRPIGDMAMIFNRVQGSGKLMTQELNMIEDSMPGFSSKMAEHFGVTQDEFRKMVTEGKVTSEDFLVVMEGHAGGMAEAYADSWQGMVENTKSWIGILGENLLSGVFEQSKESIGEFMELLKSDEAQEWAKETGKQISIAFGQIVDKVKGAIDWFNKLSDEKKKLIGVVTGVAVAAGPLLTALGTMIIFVGKVFSALSPLLLKIGEAGGLFKMLGGAVSTVSGVGKGKGLLGLTGLFKTLTKVLTAIFSGPIGWVITGILALGVAFKVAYDKVDWFKGIVDLAWDTMKIFFDTLNDLTGMNALVEWFGDAWKSTEDFRNKVGETMGNVIEWIGDTFNEKIKEPFESFKSMFRQAGETVDVFDSDVSEATTSVVTSYVEMSEGAKAELDKLYYGQEEVTANMYEDLIQKYSLMNQEANTQLEERKNSELAKLRELYEESGLYTDEELEKRLNKTAEHYEEEKLRLDGQNERIQKVIEDAMASEEGLTEEHYKIIEGLQTTHNETTIQTLTDSEVEQQAILERMSINQLATSEETLNQLLKDSKKAKDGAISEAEEKRDRLIAEAIRQRDETGEISEEEAAAIIQAAENGYRESVRKAESRHRDVVSEARAQASEHGIIVDGETGDILSKWDVFARDFSMSMSFIASMAKTKAEDIGYNIYNGIVSWINSVIDSINSISSALGLGNLFSPLNRKYRGHTQGAHGGYRPIAAYSTGTNFHKGGAALVGDVGSGNGTGKPSSTREIIELPNKKRYLADGNVLFPDFPTGAKVFNNKDTEAILANEYASSGVGSGMLGMPILSSPTLTGQNKMAKVGASFGYMLRNIWDYLDNPGALVSQMLSETSWGSNKTASQLIPGVISKTQIGMIDKVKEMFDNAGGRVDGSGILSKAITARFGRYPAGINFNGGRHYGLDTAHVNDPLRSPVNGKVTRVWNDHGGGNSLQIKAGELTWWFMHLNSIAKSVGEAVKIGDYLGRTGNTGNWTTGHHLHTQAMRGGIGNGFAIDPLPILRRGGYATGGLVHDGLYNLGEEGYPEWIIPTDPKRRTDAMKLLAYAGKSLQKNNGNLRPNNLPNISTGNDSSDELNELKTMVVNQNKMIELLAQVVAKEPVALYNEKKLAKELEPEISKITKYNDKREARFT